LDTLTIRRVALSALHTDPANARSHDERNLAAIATSLKQLGQAEPLVVQRSTGKAIGGNGRVAVMRSLGWIDCDVFELDLDDTQATALGIALNRTGEMAE
jgi:ParB-like chromosome segregation protein Spo0J